MLSPIPDLAEFGNALPPHGALLGLDLGTKTIGLAISDAGRRIASPLLTIRRTRFKADAEALLRHMAQNAVVGLVIGLPLNMDGTEGVRCQSTRAFASNLLRLRPELAIAFWDERLSTMAVNRTLIQEADLSRAKRAAVVDRAAAAYILQGALDRLDRERDAQP